MSTQPSSIGTSRYAGSQKSTRSGSIGSTKLPPHVEDVLHAKKRIDLRARLIKGQGVFTTQTLLPCLEKKTKILPWERQASAPKSSRTDSQPETVPQKTSSKGFGKSRKVTEQALPTDSRKHQKLVELLSKHPHGKITFTNSNEPMEVTPFWVTHRLEDSCRNARFELPSDYRRLENMTPLTYLEKHTILGHSQRRRYDKIFTKFMDKTDKCIFFNKLYLALNSMFSNSLGSANFEVLCTALYLSESFKIYSKAVFAGICALTERLFWSSYIDSNENTFYLMGANRSVLECADFCGLKWKLQDLKISMEMRALLFSLA